MIILELNKNKIFSSMGVIITKMFPKEYNLKVLKLLKENTYVALNKLCNLIRSSFPHLKNEINSTLLLLLLLNTKNDAVFSFLSKVYFEHGQNQLF